MLSNHLILCHPLLLLPSIFPSIRLLSQLFTSGGQSIGASASASVFPMNIQNLFPLGLTGLIPLLSKGLSRVFSSSIQKHQFFGTQLSIHDYWKNQNFNYMDLCQQLQRECFQTHSMRPAFILISKPETLPLPPQLCLISLMDVFTKILNKTLANQIQWYIKCKRFRHVNKRQSENKMRRQGTTTYEYKHIKNKRVRKIHTANTVVLGKALESPLDCKERQRVHPKGDQFWVFIGRTDVEAETLILWPPDTKS